MRRIIGILLLFVVGLEAIDLQCTFESTIYVPISGTACKASDVDITSRQTITSVNGETKINGSEYNMVRIKDQVVNFIPDGLGKFFPEIELLEIANSKLKKVEKKDLEKFPNLKLLVLTQNEIKFLPNDLFEGNLNH
jgi:hypothetical protein